PPPPRPPLPPYTTLFRSAPVELLLRQGVEEDVGVGERDEADPYAPEVDLGEAERQARGEVGRGFRVAAPPGGGRLVPRCGGVPADRKSTRLNSSHVSISY